MPLPSSILQSLISINRQQINQCHSYFNILKTLKGKCTDESERYKEIQTNKEHLALLVRNQVALKKALREQYEADCWDRLTFVYEAPYETCYD